MTIHQQNIPAYRFKKYLRSFAIVGLVLLIAFGGLHLWFSYNASGFLANIVSQRSQGKLKLKVKGLRFNYFTNYIEIKQGSLTTGDTLSHPATYNIQLARLSLHVGSFWPLLFKGELRLDSVKIYDPVVDVNRWRRDTTSTFIQGNISIPEEMGRIYNSLLDGLEAFGVKRIVIERGRFRFNNKMNPDSHTIELTNIYFHLVRLATDPLRRDTFVQDKQSVELRSFNQNIALPGGRHHLSFKNFRLELFQRRIELDSCTVTAQPTDSSRSSFQIYFEKLFLVGVDFNAMYRQNLIRADSVYCLEPMIHFVFDRLSGSQAAPSPARPKPEKIIRDLTGDLDLAFVGVKDAGIRIDIYGNRNRSLFNSRKDDFAMHHLRISPDSSKPVSVDQFNLLVRDYRLYNEDSSTAFGFDSVHFSNNKMVLNNFTVVTTPSRLGSHNIRNFRIPHFELVGLDWYELLFEENLLAREATLYKPVIYYKGALRNPARKRTNLFQLLKNTNDMLTLERISVVNGQLDMQFSSGASLQLKNANLSLHSNRLLASKDNEGLRQAIDVLTFSNGIIERNDITTTLDSVYYTGRNLLAARTVNISNKKKTLNATLRSVLMNNLLLNEKTQSVIIDGLQWQGGDIKLETTGGGKDNRSDLTIRNIEGRNTQLQFTREGKELSTYLRSLKADAISLKENRPLQIDGLMLSGSRFSLDGGQLTVKADEYHIEDNAPSRLSGFELNRFTESDSLQVLLPEANFSLDINALLQDNIRLNKVHLQSPGLSFTSRKGNGEKKDSVNNKQSIHIGRLTASTPSMHAVIHNNDSASIINLPRSDEGQISLNDLSLKQDGLTIGRLSMKNNTASFTKASGEVLGVEKGNVDVELSDIHIARGKTKPDWRLLVNRMELQDPNNYTTAKGHRFSFQTASAGNLQLSSDAITDMNKLARLNVTAWVRSTTGQYIDSNTTLKWFNAGYDATDKELTLDSFVAHPTMPRDSVIAATPFQTDYKTFHSGPVKFTGFDLERYNKDSIFMASTISFQRPKITIYRDKRLPFRGGVVRPLPVDLIKMINLPVSVNRVNLVNGSLSYTEMSPKTNKEGTIELTRMYASLSNIKNQELRHDDSLSLSLDAILLDSAQLSLRVKESYTDSLSGFLMTLRMKPTSPLSFINPVLMPLSSIKIRSGTIDSLHLRAIGNEYVSLGAMNMYYNNLKIRLLKDGDETNSSLYRKMLSFLANTFVIKKSNAGDQSIVYFERLRERSFFNYIVKMTFSGMASSIGLKNNRKYLRLYKKELEKGHIPPIRFDDALEETLGNKNQLKGTKLEGRNGKERN